MVARLWLLASVALAGGVAALDTARAQTAPAAAASAAAVLPAAARGPLTVLPDEPSADRLEPVVRHNVFEDGGSKVDELVVRGEVQHVVVTPKVGFTRSYEIIVQRGGRTPPDSTGGAMSAVGKRVWNVLAF